MDVLVTGATGFVGANVARVLVAHAALVSGSSLPRPAASGRSRVAGSRWCGATSSSPHTLTAQGGWARHRDHARELRRHDRVDPLFSNVPHRVVEEVTSKRVLSRWPWLSHSCG